MADIIGKLCCFLSTLCCCGGSAVKHEACTQEKASSRKQTAPAACLAQATPGIKGWRRYFSSNTDGSSTSCQDNAAHLASTAACSPSVTLSTKCFNGGTTCLQQPGISSAPCPSSQPPSASPDDSDEGHRHPTCDKISCCSSNSTHSIRSDSSCFSSSSYGSTNSTSKSGDSCASSPNTFNSQQQATSNCLPVTACLSTPCPVIAKVTAANTPAGAKASSTNDDTPVSPTSSSSFSSPLFQVGCHSEQNARTHMEDRTLVLHLSACEPFANTVTRACLVAVFDGHGGHQAAQLLLSLLPQHLLQQPGLLTAPAAALEAAVLASEHALLSELAAAGCDGTGSTLLAVLLLDDCLYIANVGDCRAVLGKGTEALQITRDHKPSCSIEAARIAAADPYATVSEDGYLYGELAVGRALGSPKLKRDASKKALVAVPELFTTQLTSCHDFLVLASDGLWDGLSNREAVATVRRSLATDRKADTAAAALVKRAVQMGSGDNISVLVVLLHDRPILLPKSNSRLFARRLPAETSGDGSTSTSSLSTSNSAVSLGCSSSQLSLASSSCSIAEESGAVAVVV